MLALLVALGASGCGAQFDPQSQVEGLRVLGVKKSSPYVRPGQAVDLELLWHDAEPGRPVPQIAWLGICENPPADLFQACFTQVPDLTEEELATRISLPDPALAVPNDRFRLTASLDLISSRPPPPDPATIPYGLEYVFFAACAGQLAVAPGGQFPFVCYAEEDGQAGFSAGDTQLGSRDFVIGYTAVFAYAELANQNPLIYGFEFDGLTLWPDSPAEVAAAAPPEAVLLPARDFCIGGSCDADVSEADSATCPAELSVDTCVGECDEISFRPLVDPSSAEEDDAASSRSAEVLGEQMWVNYYAAGGEISEEVRLLNDATLGWNQDYASDYKPKEEAGVSYLWAVAHDSRGGTEWARVRVCTR